MLMSFEGGNLSWKFAIKAKICDRDLILNRENCSDST